MGRRDGLTGLWDKGSLEEDLSRDLDDARSSGKPLSLVLVDLDHFKRVNDEHGHPKGDTVLAGVAGRLRAVVDGKGEAYRFGGEEMLLVLPNHTIEEAVAVAERARRDLESKPVAMLSVTGSFGVSTFPEHGEDKEALIGAADKALYDAKNRGRNLVRFANEPEPRKDGPREPERKFPIPGRLTEKVKRKLRLEYLRVGHIVCPDDGVPLKVHDVTSSGSVGKALVVTCPACGFHEDLGDGSERA